MLNSHSASAAPAEAQPDRPVRAVSDLDIHVAEVAEITHVAETPVIVASGIVVACLLEIVVLRRLLLLIRGRGFCRLLRRIRRR